MRPDARPRHIATRDIRLSYTTALPWTLENLDLDRIDVARIRHDEDLFFLLCSSSFVESGSDLYTQNLIDHFAGDQELQTWLGQHWEHEELQHGRALAAYVRKVWPEFDWDKGFQAFWTEYGAVCTAEQLEPSRGLELAARCVVETGTASLYRALNEITDEPVLKQLTSYIKSDEVRHYKYFYHHYRLYREREGFGRYKVFRAILRRVNEIRERGQRHRAAPRVQPVLPAAPRQRKRIPPHQRPRAGAAAPAHPGRDDGEDAAQAAGPASRDCRARWKSRWRRSPRGCSCTDARHAPAGHSSPAASRGSALICRCFCCSSRQAFHVDGTDLRDGAGEIAAPGEHLVEAHHHLVDVGGDPDGCWRKPDPGSPPRSSNQASFGRV